MEFPQQVEETLVERPPFHYDVVMESPLYQPNNTANMEAAPSTGTGGTVLVTAVAGASAQIPQQADKMNGSVNSTLTDTTPSDSGVQLLDSESSEVMIESITSQMGFEFEETRAPATVPTPLSSDGDRVVAVLASLAPQLVDTNLNVTSMDGTESAVVVPGAPQPPPAAAPAQTVQVEEGMIDSTCSTFDTSDQIVYRRKARKPANGGANGNGTKAAPKKRVSFHEDILKSTRTDNIHIEHGFITYKMGGGAGRRNLAHGSRMAAAGGGRYSWCPEGDRGHGPGGQRNDPSALNALNDDDGGSNGDDAQIGGDGRRSGARHIGLYRNACSDVLDYGNSDVYETHQDEPSHCLRYDNSGVFEYQPQQQQKQAGPTASTGVGAQAPVLYRCSCSSSNSSLDSDEEANANGASTDKNSNHQQRRRNQQQYGQAKSSSCDCIRTSQNAGAISNNNNNNTVIGDNCYFSEPSIERLTARKSVWNKEQQPKTSCLKNSRRHTHIIHEQDLTAKVKKFNVHDMNQLLDNSSKMLFGSLKSIFTMPLPERGVPEGSEDLQAVVECVPEPEATPEHKQRPHNLAPLSRNQQEASQARPRQQQQHTAVEQEVSPDSASPEDSPLKQKPFLSKSLDGSKQAAPENRFVHNVDDQLRRKNAAELFAPTRQSSAENTVKEGMPVAKDNVDGLDDGSQLRTPLRRQDEIDSDTEIVEMRTPPQLTPLRQATPQHPAQQQQGGRAQMSPQSGGTPSAPPQQQQFRNKFIVNCESTVFEHTGVSYETNTAFGSISNMIADSEGAQPGAHLYGEAETHTMDNSMAGHLLEKTTPIAQPEQPRTFMSAAPIARHFTNFFRSFKDSGAAASSGNQNAAARSSANAVSSNKPPPQSMPPASSQEINKPPLRPHSTAGGVADVPLPLPITSTPTLSLGRGNSLAVGGGDVRTQLDRQSRHLPSPLKKRNNSDCASSGVMQPPRYNTNGGGGAVLGGVGCMTAPDVSQLSSDVYNAYHAMRGGCGRDSKSTILSDELDDILTITTEMDATMERQDVSDMVIVDYTEVAGAVSQGGHHSTPTTAAGRNNNYINGSTSTSTSSGINYFLKPPSSKSSLINRFLRNATQKKLMEASIHRNDFFANKIRNEQRRYGAAMAGELYVRGARPQNYELIDDLNAEIAMEIEMSGGVNSPRRELTDLGGPDAGRARDRGCGGSGVPGGVAAGVGSVCGDGRRRRRASERTALMNVHNNHDDDDDNEDVLNDDDDDDDGGRADDEDDLLMLSGDVVRFELGIGEIAVDVFNGNGLGCASGSSGRLQLMRDSNEQLLKIFKLYTGYSRVGHMTPVLVFLTDRTLYVADLVRSRLCTKFALSYVDLDVILMGPFGNTVLLSNSERDMQQVLLAGGPYPAAGLVANLEMCARRSGSQLPAVGQLTLSHLAPLQAFVRANSCVDKSDVWLYYAVINVPAGGVLLNGHASSGGGGGGDIDNCHDGADQEPLGPHIKGFLMHRRLGDQHQGGGSKQNASRGPKIGWNPGYFLLKAGVLYMFSDSGQKLPSWAMALAECQGARRAVRAGRPHCFEILLRGGEALQLAAPDEYVASEWLQALLQSASGLFEMQEKHKTLGCTLVVTQHHLITLREDFGAPLCRQFVGTKQQRQRAMVGNDGFAVTTPPSSSLLLPSQETEELSLIGLAGETLSLLSSTVSTPTRGGGTQHSISSRCSTPTRLSSSRSSITARDSVSTSLATSTATTSTTSQRRRCEELANAEKRRHDNDDGGEDNASFTHMSSVYGKNSGVEILTCADIKDMTGIKIPSHNDTWWCILEFSCQEVRESSDDLVIFFASSSEMQRFLRLLEQLWQAKNNDLFPITILDEDDALAEQCTTLYMDINRSWEPLLSAALGYPL